MDKINFAWDAKKASSNKNKHGITFDEARTVFFDEHARVISDTEHADNEERFVILGLSSLARLLIVCHCYREDNHTIRLISARKATRNESRQYRR